ncbi:MAG: hypothetical protein GX281_04065 [Bacteroidales bacterium]|jgi:hypothetical protein|nr:hypothetical protein [Bacteroidales bacterium]NLK79876.1 hypothetical protein [Bacteroidales bacterium]HPX79581.1 hypothetical protein [Bacteroidales bacterium]HQB23544.1 hypothetical protein [Bacteroidales bacterium]
MKKYGTILWVGLLAAITAFLIIKPTHLLFVHATERYPYLMGFVKFAILSMMGEFLAARIVHKEWVMVKGVLPKMLVWGILGMMIVLMFSVFSGGVDNAVAQGLIGGCSGSCPVAVQYFFKFRRALLISVFMNLTFGPVFMAAHRVTDVYIDKRYQGEKSSVGSIVDSIDWGKFIKEIVGVTIPVFWIPAHTVTFLLPGTYRVLFAASLSIVLGLILSFAKMRK